MKPVRLGRCCVLAVLVLLLFLVVLSGCDSIGGQGLAPGKYNCIAVIVDGRVTSGSESVWLEVKETKDFANGLTCFYYLQSVHLEQQGGKLTVTDLYGTDSEGEPEMGEPYGGTVSDGMLMLDYSGCVYVFAPKDADLSAWRPNDLLDGGTEKTTEGLSLEDASSQGGFFIKSSDLFYPLADAYFVGEIAPAITDDGAVATSSGIIPRLKDNEELVLFSDWSVWQVNLNCADEQGYTIPICAYSDGYTDRIFIPPALYDQHFGEIMERYDDNAQWMAALEFFRDFQQGLSLDDAEIHFADDLADDLEYEYFDISDTRQYDNDIFFEIAGFAQNQWISIEYYVGSVWHEVMIPACVKFWYFDGGVDETVYTNTTKLGYYTIDTSGLERGTYVLYTAEYLSDTDYTTFGDLGSDDPGFAKMFSVE